MKILHVIDSGGIYGAEVMLLNLMEEQKKNHLDTSLLSIEAPDSSGTDSLTAEAQRRGLHVERFNSNRGYSLRSAVRIWRYVEDNHVDIVHSHGYKGDILLCSIPRYFRKKPVISTLHGWLSTRIFKKIWLYTQLDKLFLRRMDAIIHVNTVGKPIGKVDSFVVENGIPALKFTPDNMICHDDPLRIFSENSFVIGCISRLSEEKGLKYLIEAVSLLCKRDVPVKAILIGDGPQRTFLEELINKNNLQDKIIIAGYRENAHKYLTLFDVFVLPSLTEGLPITILEAMQAQVPIVATRVGGIPKALEDGKFGILTETGNSGSIAQAVEHLYSNPHIGRTMGRHARESALMKYSSSRMAEEYTRIYEVVCKKWKQ